MSTPEKDALAAVSTWLSAPNGSGYTIDEIKTLVTSALSAPPADAPAQKEIIVWLAHMVTFNEQLAASESSDARDREKFRNYASAYNSALTKAKQFAQPSASVQEAAERAAKEVATHLSSQPLPNHVVEWTAIIASHFAGFEQRESK